MNGYKGKTEVLTLPEYFWNYDLDNIVTTINHKLFMSLLRESGYPDDEVFFLEDGLTNGFDIGYEGPQERCSTADNIPFTVGNEVELWNKLMKEVKLGRVVGPFEKVPFENYIQYPGLVPKAGSDQTRLIFHLSYDFKKEKLGSVNHYTPKEKCTVKYRDLDYAVKTFLELSEQYDNMPEIAESGGADQKSLKRRWKQKFVQHKDISKSAKTTIFAGKSDLKSAF